MGRLFAAGCLLLAALFTASFSPEIPRKASVRTEQYFYTWPPLFEAGIEVKAKRRWPVPIAGVKKIGLGRTFYSYSKRFGGPHFGTDFNCIGSSCQSKKILASECGIVADEGKRNRHGYFVIASYPERGRACLYAHLDENYPNQRGRRLDKGSVIGRIGGRNSGRSTNPHLHVECIREGGLVTYEEFIASRSHAENTEKIFYDSRLDAR